MLSRCCKKSIYVWSANEGTSYYVCYECDQATDPISLIEKGEQDDTRIQKEVKRAVS